MDGAYEVALSKSFRAESDQVHPYGQKKENGETSFDRDGFMFLRRIFFRQRHVGR